MCIVIICFPVCDIIIFEINLSFLIKPKSQGQNLNIWRAKELSTWNKKDFSSFLKGFYVPEMSQT